MNGAPVIAWWLHGTITRYILVLARLGHDSRFGDRGLHGELASFHEEAPAGVFLTEPITHCDQNSKKHYVRNGP